MSEPDRHVGFYRIPLSQELQESLHTIGQPPNEDAPKKVPFPGIDLREFPWEYEKQDVARKIMVELAPHVKDWPGKEDLPKDWEGKDYVLHQGALVTPENQRDIYIPLPFKPGATVAIHNKDTDKVIFFQWDKSYGLAFMLERNVRILMGQGPPIRFFLLGVKCRQQRD